ncbi:DEAD/DEAH box helicase, partial [Anaerosolibacter sp.]
MKMKPTDNPQVIREEYIKALGNSENSTALAKNIAEDLFALDLTVYSDNYSLDSLVYNAFAMSIIDENISLHPEQLQIINHIKEHDASIISAPTSFGKTFCIFEYIVRYQPKNVVLIVPTLALVDEYFKKIIKKFRNKFSLYKIHTNISEDKEYDFTISNIFILTHDRVVQESSYHKIEKIDFMVIDEVYKLETDKNDDRVLVLNMAYYHLSKKAEKYVLLAPFIKSVEDTEKLEKTPVFFNTNYSPVVNEVKINRILSETDRFPETKRILAGLRADDKTLIYFPTVAGMYNYITNVIAQEPLLEELIPEVASFITWAKEEIHEDWCLITALERGYLIHNGQIPVGTRIFQLDYYEQSSIYNKLLCTSTLLEGVNTTAKNIIITKPSRKSARPGEEPFSAFDFFNLVGRTGRLFKHYIGDAYYIKSQNDPEFKKADAIKNIKFEVTDISIDIDIQTGNINEHPEVISFFKRLGITKDDYIANIGTKIRFDNIVVMYERYIINKENLIFALQQFLDN